jgi:hypothetical protein
MRQIHKHTALCRDVALHIQNELDADLLSPECRDIKKHLARCPNCTTYLDSMKKTVLLYKRYPDPHFPAITRRKLFAVLKLRS